MKAVLLTIIAVVLSCNSYRTDADDVKKVHIIFMNHLDVGYDGLLPEELGFINNVLNKYFVEYFPRAITLSEQLRILGYYEKFIYTTHPWLVSLYLNCPPNLILSGIKLKCPNATEISTFVNAVKRGDITWHAGPMNMQFEVMDVELARFGIKLSKDLDDKMNIVRKFRTLSQRDVPAMTQGIVPILEEEGVAAISVGVNTVTAPPAVPPIFRWKFQNSSVIGIWHPGGYPDNPGKIPAIPGGLSRRDCATFPGFDHALCFGFRTDNSGPPINITEVLLYYEIARSQFPGADVQATTFEDFVEALQPIKDKLPVIDKEFGDTWIEGTGSDPRKVAEMRALMRARSKCLEIETGCSMSDSRLYNSSVLMLKLGEHTWGLSSVFDSVHWSNDKFYAMLDNKKKNINLTNGVLSWQEQRNFSYMAIDALGSHTLATQMKYELSQIYARKPDITGLMKVKDMLAAQECTNGFSLQFDNEGTIISLRDPITKRDWASASNPIGRFAYQSLNQSDFDYFNGSYPYSKHFQLGIGKPNMSANAKPESKIWKLKMTDLFKGSKCNFVMMATFVDHSCMSEYGCPVSITVEYKAEINQNTGLGGVDITLQWFKKAPTRLPESIYFVFQPVQNTDMSWKLHKLGQMIDPLNVILNGSQRQHAVDKGVYYTDNNCKGLEILSYDVALVNVLTPQHYVSPIPLPLKPLNEVNGMAFNLYNNIWDVNWIFWYPFEKRDLDQKFRFRINIS
ncbi:uncharacterized protein LOC127701658 [Mytilus californianus]|uniref:uncharacterized protein LOC127701658 n=1 Tax=Mytilus californianus TaxID=6549 RepID=UPI002245707C|nr:uncharacterized protein LOC127701658 [Mytilus californianus]